MRFRFIKEHRHQHRVRTMCRVLDVSCSGFYAWFKRPLSATAALDQKLRGEIEAVFTESRSTYGSPRVHAAMRHRGRRGSRKRVARIMRDAGLMPRGRRRQRATTTDSRHSMPIAPNLLQRKFSPVTDPNRAWAADITHIPTEEGFLYLALLMDLCSRRIVGFEMSSRLHTAVALEALVMALGRCDAQPRLLHHSDRGVQYASREYQSVLVEYGIVCSMSRKGDCYDNAAVESFFHTLKTELVHHETFETRDDARARIFEYVEVCHNRRRLHSTLGYRVPAQAHSDGSVC